MPSEAARAVGAACADRGGVGTGTSAGDGGRDVVLGAGAGVGAPGNGRGAVVPWAATDASQVVAMTAVSALARLFTNTQ